MANKPNDAWVADAEKFKAWLGNRVFLHKRAFDPEKPTLKTLVYLALLDQKEPISYDDIRAILEKTGVIKGEVSKDSLRVAVSDLSKSLAEPGQPVALVSERRGRRQRFRLVPRADGSLAKKENLPVLVLYPQDTKPEDIARTLMQEARLPFWAMYYFPRSACWYVHLTAEEGEQRKVREAETWEKLGVRQRVLKAAGEGPIGLVCLAAHGEGLGEIELLRKMLKEGKTVHFLTMDVSSVFLASQLGIIRVVFAEEIKAGRLICWGVLGNPLVDGLESILLRARQELVRFQLIASPEDFLGARCSAVTACYFANCLGNNYLDREYDIFAATLSAFRDRHLEILVGVSVRQKPESYHTSWYDFLLQAPNYLKASVGLLRAVGEEKLEVKYKEFVLPQGNKEQDEKLRNERCPPAKPEPYHASHNVTGDIYRFYYRLNFDLEMPSTGLKLGKTTRVLLYSIVKYQLDSLVTGIEARGRFKVAYNETKPQDVKTRAGEGRHYEVFAAYLDP